MKKNSLICKHINDLRTCMKVQKHSLNLTKKPSSFAKLSTFVLVQSIGTLFAEMKKITQSYQTKKNPPIQS